MGQTLRAHWALLTDYCCRRKSDDDAEIAPADLQKALMALALMPSTSTLQARTAMSRLRQLSHEEQTHALWLSVDTVAGSIDFRKLEAAVLSLATHGIPMPPPPPRHGRRSGSFSPPEPSGSESPRLRDGTVGFVASWAPAEDKYDPVLSPRGQPASLRVQWGARPDPALAFGSDASSPVGPEDRSVSLPTTRVVPPPRLAAMAAAPSPVRPLRGALVTTPRWGAAQEDLYHVGEAHGRSKSVPGARPPNKHRARLNSKPIVVV